MSDNKPVVFLIHGMGVHSDKWEDSWLMSMQETLTKSGYANFQAKKSLEESIDFYPINYDNVFVDLMAGWANTATEMQKLSGISMAGELSDAVDWVADITKSEENFVRDSAMDVLLWRLAHVTRNDIINQVAEQITTRLKDLSPVRRMNCHVLSHSLGTSIMDRVLDALARNEWQNGAPSGFDYKKFRFDSIHTIANVSLIL
jgi:hypothetical protein